MMPKGDPAGYLPNVQASRKKKRKKIPSKKGKMMVEELVKRRGSKG